MAKKKKGLLKFAVGVGAVAVAGKVAYDKVKAAKNKLTKEEQDSAELEVRKYNAVCEKRDVEIEDEEFMGCEVKAIASKLTVDLSLAVSFGCSPGTYGSTFLILFSHAFTFSSSFHIYSYIFIL